MSSTNNIEHCARDWSRVNLSDCLEEVSTRNARRERLPVLSVTNKSGFVLQSETFGRELHSADTSHYRIVSRGEFGYNPARINVGSIGRLMQFDRGLLSPMYVVFRTSNRLAPDFLEHYVQTERFLRQVEKNAEGSVRQTLNFSAFRHFELALPDSLAEQSTIADVLTTVDRALGDAYKLINKLRRMRNGLTQDLLTRGIDDNGDVRTEKGHNFVNSPLGAVPKEWSIDTLDNATARITVGLATSVTKYYRERGVPLIRNQNIRKGFFDGSELMFLDPAFASRFPGKQLTKGDVLICRTGANVGDTCLVPDEYVGSQTFTTLIVSPRNNRLDPAFLVQYMNSQLGARELNYVLVGAGKNNLNAGHVARVRLLLPSVAEQRSICSALSVIENSIQEEERFRSKLLLVKRGLMEDLLGGERSVSII
jgi:type I restriction enzyme S subunit